jgi:hypothetical protein
VNQDFLDLLADLLASEARFMVVGAHALAAHGVPRATGDLDVWVARDLDNARRIWSALVRFGAPVSSAGIKAEDLAKPDQVFQIGLPPRRIDVLTSISGVEFEQAWPGRIVRPVETLAVPFIGREALISNKRATGRAKDKADLEALGVKA